MIAEQSVGTGARLERVEQRGVVTAVSAVDRPHRSLPATGGDRIPGSRPEAQ